MEKARKTIWPASVSLCLGALLHHILGPHETAATVADAGRTTASDERTALDQALLLVELLKSEHSRVLLRENDELQGKDAFRTTDEQTCATTTENPSQVLVTLTDNQNSKISFQGTHPDAVASTHPPATPLQPWDARRSLNGFRHRRRWRPPAAYFYYDTDAPFRRSYNNEEYTGADIGTGNWRRFDYDEVFGPQPVINKTTTTKTTVASSKHRTTAGLVSSMKTTVSHAVSDSSGLTVGGISTNVSNEIVNKPQSKAKIPYTSKTTDKRKISFEVKINASPSQFVSTTHKIEIIGQNNPPRYVRKKPLSLANKVNGTSSTQMREPELMQAAAELAKELGTGAAPGVFRHRFPILWRGSTKVYLADSTRYPIPLPQNHAFCFTNPHNALCRTFI